MLRSKSGVIRTRFAWRIPRPDANGFGLIAGVEAVIRGTTLTVFPLVMYRAWGSAAMVSKIYFVIGLLSLMTALTKGLFEARLRSPKPKAWLVESVGFNHSRRIASSA